MSSEDDGLFGSRLMLEILRLLGGDGVLLEVLLLLIGLLLRPAFLLPPLGLRRRGDLDGLLLLGLCDLISLLIFGTGDLGGDFFVLQLRRLSTLFERDLRELLDRDLRLDDLEGDLLRPLMELGLLLGDRGLLFGDLRGDLPPRNVVGLESCRRRDALSPDWLWQGLRDRRLPLRLLLYPLLGLGDLLKPLRLLLEGLRDMRLQETFRRLSDHRSWPPLPPKLLPRDLVSGRRRTLS